MADSEDTHPIELMAPNGVALQGTSEEIPGCAQLLYLRRNAVGETESDWVGGTEVFWDGQQTIMWRGQKVLWARAPSYRGPLLIRGHQLDGTWWVGFEYGQPLQELQIRPLPASVKGWQGLPTATRIRSAGCYAYQVDGTTFSAVIVFRAT